MRLPDELPVKIDFTRVLLDKPPVESVPLHPPTAKKASENLEATTEFIRSWQAWEPAPEVDWEERNWASAGLGVQRVPVRVRLGDWDRIAERTGQTPVLRQARSRNAVLQELAPSSDDFTVAVARSHPSWMKLTDSDFERLVSALKWFRNNPASGLRARAVPIEGMDTKWIERHRGLILRLLTPLGVTDLGLSTGDATVRVRFLDESLAPNPALLDVSVPFGIDPTHPHTGLTVVIVENKETFLALPPAAVGSRLVAVWGAGYHGAALAARDWIATSDILYWGDADADGYAILNALRSHLPESKAISVAMDPATISRFLHLAVSDPGDAGRHLPHLTVEEENARKLLISSGNLRLEQERVSLDWALAQPAFAAAWHGT